MAMIRALTPMNKDRYWVITSPTNLYSQKYEKKRKTEDEHTIPPIPVKSVLSSFALLVLRFP
jgi:hypothetical protein